MLYRPPYCCCSTGSTSWNLQRSRGFTSQARRDITSSAARTHGTFSPQSSPGYKQVAGGTQLLEQVFQTVAKG